MTVTWTPEQVLNLSPDEASRKNANSLANPRKWKRLSKNENEPDRVIWGEYQGSGTDPYRCQVDTSGPAYKCSCPSKKTPCKHALGLFLLFASQPGVFETGETPDWVAAWLARRAEINEKRTAKNAGAQPSAPGRPATADPQAQARRAVERDRKIRAGLDELETWLYDMLRQGLAAAQSQPRSFWETAAARLVDAQAPGLAHILRDDMPAAVSSGEGWQERLLECITRLYLTLEGYRRIDQLPEENRADLRTLVGINWKQEDLLEGPGVTDTWLVLGREREEETKLIVQRIWLQGQVSGHPALLLSFAPAGGALDGSLVPGMAFPGDLVFYPGAFPMRALIRTREPAQALPSVIPGFASLGDAAAAYAAALSAFPWLDRFPLALADVVPVQEDGEWVLYDSCRRRAPLEKRFLHGWTLQAISGGYPMGVYGIWNGVRLLPLSAWTGDTFFAFRPQVE